jgi:hypothetical protein
MVNRNAAKRLAGLRCAEGTQIKTGPRQWTIDVVIRLERLSHGKPRDRLLQHLDKLLFSKSALRHVRLPRPRPRSGLTRLIAQSLHDIL